MKNTIKNILSLLVCASALFSCEKETTPEPVQVQDPNKLAPFVRDNAYFARLRAYKQTDHKLAFGWFGSWTAIGASEQSRLRSAPDSMDIISMWSQWHSLTSEQIEDKAFVQQVLGTKVVFCISAKDVPEEFKEEGQITDAAIEAYARAWGKDSMDKYQYDGIDIDFETASDHLGPLNTTPGAFKKFCEQLSRYIGPQSGTGRLFLIDGNIDQLDQGIAELCDYAVSQAYNSGSASDLQGRTSSAGRVGWRPEQMIFTENFESLWKTGGSNHRTLSGEYMPSLLGMADFAKNGTSCGFGSYHMEYEYGHADMPYKYIRQAIQLANPAPRGDYSKNLLTINEAGESSHTIAVYPSGLNEEFGTTFTASLTGVPASDVDIPLTVDNSLVAGYNDYYYTDYKTLDPAIVVFSGALHFAAGAQETEEAVTATISDVSSLVEGEEYLVPIRADFSKNPKFSANLDMEVRYLKVKIQRTVCTIAIQGSGSVTDVLSYAMPDGTISEEGVYTLQAMLSPTAPADVEFTLDFDASLVEAYNAANGTSYAAMNRNNLSMPEKVQLKKASNLTEPCQIKAVDQQSLTAAGSMVALRLNLGGNPDYQGGSETSLIKYLVFKKVVNNLKDQVTSVDGTPIADMTGWSYKGNITDGYYNESYMFNGNLKDWGWYAMQGSSITVTVDMTQSHTLSGFRISPFSGGNYGYMYRLYNVETSIDGQNWEPQGANEFVRLAAPQEGWQYVGFIKPVECRYIRHTFKGNSGDMSSWYIGCNEFSAIEAN